MLAAFDYVGLAAVISAIFAGTATLLGALNRRNVTNVQQKLDTNGDSRTVGAIISDVGAQVAPDPTPAPAVPETKP